MLHKKRFFLFLVFILTCLILPNVYSKLYIGDSTKLYSYDEYNLQLLYTDTATITFLNNIDGTYFLVTSDGKIKTSTNLTSFTTIYDDALYVSRVKKVFNNTLAGIYSTSTADGSLGRIMIYNGTGFQTYLSTTQYLMQVLDFTDRDNAYNTFAGGSIRILNRGEIYSRSSISSYSIRHNSYYAGTTSFFMFNNSLYCLSHGVSSYSGEFYGGDIIKLTGTTWSVFYNSPTFDFIQEGIEFNNKMFLIAGNNYVTPVKRNIYVYQTGTLVPVFNATGSSGTDYRTQLFNVYKEKLYAVPKNVLLKYNGIGFNTTLPQLVSINMIYSEADVFNITSPANNSNHLKNQNINMQFYKDYYGNCTLSGGNLQLSVPASNGNNQYSFNFTTEGMYTLNCSDIVMYFNISYTPQIVIDTVLPTNNTRGTSNPNIFFDIEIVGSTVPIACSLTDDMSQDIGINITGITESGTYNISNNITLGLFRYKIRCWDSGSISGITQTYQYIKDYRPIATTFDNTSSTNLNNITDYYNVQSFILSKVQTSIRWINNVNLINQNLDANVILNHGLVSLNTTALDASLDSEANVTFNLASIDASCTDYELYYANQTFFVREDVMQNGQLVAKYDDMSSNCTNDTICRDVRCSGDILTFTALHFDSYSAFNSQDITELDRQISQLILTTHIGFSIIAIMLIAGAGLAIVSVFRSDKNVGYVLLQMLAIAGAGIVLIIGYVIILMLAGMIN